MRRISKVIARVQCTEGKAPLDGIDGNSNTAGKSSSQKPLQVVNFVSIA